MTTTGLTVQLSIATLVVMIVYDRLFLMLNLIRILMLLTLMSRLMTCILLTCGLRFYTCVSIVVMTGIVVTRSVASESANRALVHLSTRKGMSTLMIVNNSIYGRQGCRVCIRFPTRVTGSSRVVVSVMWMKIRNVGLMHLIVTWTNRHGAF